jgi:hypothetical protein
LPAGEHLSASVRRCRRPSPHPRARRLRRLGPSTDTNAAASAGTAPPGGARRGFLQDPKVVACLKKAGVTVPSRPRGADGGPPGAQNRRPGSAQFQKLRAALQKCGVTFQGRPPNGQPPPGGQGTTSTSAS